MGVTYAQEADVESKVIKDRERGIASDFLKEEYLESHRRISAVEARKLACRTGIMWQSMVNEEIERLRTKLPEEAKEWTPDQVDDFVGAELAKLGLEYFRNKLRKDADIAEFARPDMFGHTFDWITSFMFTKNDARELIVRSKMHEYQQLGYWTMEMVTDMDKLFRRGLVTLEEMEESVNDIERAAELQTTRKAEALKEEEASGLAGTPAAAQGLTVTRAERRRAKKAKR